MKLSNAVAYSLVSLPGAMAWGGVYWPPRDAPSIIFASFLTSAFFEPRSGTRNDSLCCKQLCRQYDRSLPEAAPW